MSEQTNKRTYEDFESYDDIPASEKYSKPSVFSVVMRIIFYTLIMIVNCAVIFRVCMADDPKSVTSPEINEVLKKAYAENGDFSVKTQTVYDMYTEDGIFYATGMFYCPSASQLQVTIRYNYRTMPDILISDELGLGFDTVEQLSDEEREQSKYNSLSGSDVKNNEYFAYRLVDDEGKIYEPSNKTKLPRFLYVYQTLTFDGVEITDNNLYVQLYMIRDGEPDYSVPVGKMKIYSTERELSDYELSGSDIKKLKK